MSAKHLNECISHALKSRNISAATFDEAGFRVFERYGYNAQSVFSAIGKGGCILPIVNAAYLGGADGETTYCSILAVNSVKHEVTLYNPIDDKDMVADVQSFLDVWNASGANCVAAFPIDEATYFPAMNDLSHIELSPDLANLCEELAEHAHDAWAIERQSEGWTYGPKRNDAKLQTPDMKPYSQLPDTEKQYDRIMATNTIKFLVSHGYKVVKE